MKIGNRHVRYQDPNVYKIINGVQYLFSPATYVDKSKAYYIAKRAEKGKVMLDPEKRSVEVQEDGTLKYEKI